MPCYSCYIPVYPHPLSTFVLSIADSTSQIIQTSPHYDLREWFKTPKLSSVVGNKLTKSDQPKNKTTKSLWTRLRMEFVGSYLLCPYYACTMTNVYVSLEVLTYRAYISYLQTFGVVPSARTTPAVKNCCCLLLMCSLSLLWRLEETEFQFFLKKI